MIRKAYISLLLGSSLVMNLMAQDNQPSKWMVKGYLKDLLTINVTDDSTLVDNLIHNRTNFKWYGSDYMTATLEIRTRIFSGDLQRAIPNYRQLIDVNNDFLDLSVDFSNSGNTILFHSMIDRAYLEWYNENWEIRFGRQRVNWGVNLVWNPNDLFNAYSFFDFDYGERPGSDALRLKRFLGAASSLEVAINAADTFSEMVIAGLWKANRWNYDFQLLLGKARQDFVIGGGWAGNIGNAGFKGEVSYFHPYTDRDLNKATLLLTLSGDYSFENSLYLNTSILINTQGSSDPVNLIALSGSQALTARSLSPFKYSTFFQLSYQLHPLISAGLATIYYPGKRNAVFFNPTMTFSLSPNFDLDFVSQLYYDEILGEYSAQARLFFFRLKWSY